MCVSHPRARPTAGKASCFRRCSTEHAFLPALTQPLVPSYLPARPSPGPHSQSPPSSPILTSRPREGALPFEPHRRGQCFGPEAVAGASSFRLCWLWNAGPASGPKGGQGGGCGSRPPSPSGGQHPAAVSAPLLPKAAQADRQRQDIMLRTEYIWLHICTWLLLKWVVVAIVFPQ